MQKKEEKKTNTQEKAVSIDTFEMVDRLVQNAQQALKEYMELDQEQVDKIVHAMTLAGLDKHMLLAKMAYEETGRGVMEDKVIKNIFSTEYIWHSIKKQKTVGVIDENEMEGYVEVAEPVGVVAGVTPVTNPTSTTMFKSLICAKTRNPIIFGFHPSAQKCSAQAARILRDAAVKAGAPEHCIQWIETPSLDATSALMNHRGVSLILATGGSGMVKAAYSAGKPALGVSNGTYSRVAGAVGGIFHAVQPLVSPNQRVGVSISGLPLVRLDGLAAIFADVKLVTRHGFTPWSLPSLCAWRAFLLPPCPSLRGTAVPPPPRRAEHCPAQAAR